MSQEKFKEAIAKLRNPEKKRNFEQTVELIINLKNFDVRRESFNIFIELPHKVKEKKIMGFFEKQSSIIDTTKKENFPNFKDKKDVKKLVNKYDFFIANAKLMPAVATAFGRTLGPVGKMPSPQLGILPKEDDDLVKTLVEKINHTIRVRVKEPSIKIPIGKEKMSDDVLADNLDATYQKILETLPKKIDNVRNVKVKFTMGHPTLVSL